MTTDGPVRKRQGVIYAYPERLDPILAQLRRAVARTVTCGARACLRRKRSRLPPLLQEPPRPVTL